MAKNIMLDIPNGEALKLLYEDIKKLGITDKDISESTNTKEVDK